MIDTTVSFSILNTIHMTMLYTVYKDFDCELAEAQLHTTAIDKEACEFHLNYYTVFISFLKLGAAK